ncbi:MAG: 2-5 ligase [Deltaproteobacteria bacterium]|nr:2-5 ligase [Deltaproteobacteria bacterium]
MAPHDDALRIFFAVEIGDAARRAARAVAERLAAAPGGDAVRWVRPESYHVTLRFLGATPRDRVAGLVATARRATRAIAPFELRLGALAGFPSRRPRAVVLDVAPHETIVALAREVERAVVEAGFAPEQRAFHPHLTLGRVRERRAPFLDPEEHPAAAAPFAVGCFVLFQSVPATTGTQYTPLERISLGGTFSP